MKLLLFTLLFSSISFAGHEKDSNCHKLRRDASSLCVIQSAECTDKVVACEYQDESLFPDDTSHNESQKINDTDRNKEKAAPIDDEGASGGKDSHGGDK